MFNFKKKTQELEEQIAQLQAQNAVMDARLANLEKELALGKELKRKEKTSAPAPAAVPAPALSKKDAIIQNIMGKTGWTREETVKKVEQARKKVGINYTDYEKYAFYHVPVENQKEEYKEILKKKQEAKEFLQAQIESCVVPAMEANNWTRAQAEKHLKETRARTGCMYKEYRMYKFYELTDAQQDEYPLACFTAKLSSRFNVNKKFVKMLNNKALTNEYFSQFMNRLWCINSKISREEFVEKFSQCPRVIYKPIEGIGGHGVEAFNLTPDTISDVYDQLQQLPDGVVEEYVVQHPEMCKLSPTSVNTMRIVTIVSKKQPVTPEGKYMDIAYIAVRIGGGGAIVDNFNSGGMLASVDKQTGVIVTNAVDHAGNVYEKHPVTGTVFKGFTIPCFAEAIKMVEQMCAMGEVAGNLGWDVAISEKGPTLIEANVGPGPVALVGPYVEEKKGTKHILEKYMIYADQYEKEQAEKAKAEALAKMDPEEAKKEAQRAENRHYLEKTMEATGWSREEANAAIKEARARTGCTYKEYYLYNFYKMDKETQDNVFLMSYSRKITKRYTADKKFIQVLCSKERTNEMFADYVRRPWCVNTKISEKKFVETFKNVDRVIYKPANGNRGFGVEAFDLNVDNIRDVYATLAKYPEGVVEQFVVQHPAMSALAPSSVNTLRVVTISSNTQPVTPDGKMMDIAYVALRIGGGNAVVDNFHSGGMAAAVDMETGILATNAVDMEAKVYEKHPMTGVAIKGFQIPFFKETLEMVTEACVKHQVQGYLGWDVAITEEGPKLIEVNNLPGVVLLSTPYAAEGKGMKHTMEKYLHDEC